MDTVTNTLLFLHIFCCFFLTGLIWIIQLVHYPSFQWVDKNKTNSFINFHTKRISFIVIPIMLLELISGIFLLETFSNTKYLYFFSINLISLVAIWISTFVLSVPCHKKLIFYFEIKTIKRLVKTNWPRTLLWSLRSILFCLFLFQLNK